MNKLLLVLVLQINLINSSFGQKPINAKLKRKLDSILIDDQRYRNSMAMQPGKQRDSIAAIFHIDPDNVNEYFSKLQNVLDSINIEKVEQIINSVGYPGKSLVGVPGNEAAYYVLQHSEKIKKYFPVIEKAGIDKELPFNLVAMMHDRFLVEEGKEQIYGTQIKGIAIKDPVTHQQKIDWFVWPVNDQLNVNKRRKEAGFDDTVEENAAALGAEYKPMTLSEARKRYPMLFPK